MKHTRQLAVCTLLALLYPGFSWADAIGIAPYLELGVSHDSNIFRVENDAGAQAATGGTHRGDTIFRGAIGGAAEWGYSRQRLRIGGEVSKERYDRFSRLDHNENQLRGALDYSIGSVITGTLSYRREKRLDDFDDIDSGQPNFVTESQPLLETFVNITPSWRVRGQFSHLRIDQSLASQKNFDLRENQYLLELDYLGSPGSIYGSGVEVLTGEYPGRSNNGVLARKFDQETFFLSANWRFSGVSTIRSRLGYTQRNSSDGGSRDFNGATGNLQYLRTLSGKTQLQFELFRRIYSVDNVDANFVRQTGGSATLRYVYSPKLELSAVMSHNNRKYQNLSGFSGSREDKINTLTGELTYQPYKILSFIFSLSGERRDSNADGESYDDIAGGLAVRLTFDND